MPLDTLHILAPSAIKCPFQDTAPPLFSPSGAPERIKAETGKESNWDEDNAAMLQKYYYLKHSILVSI